MPKLEFKEKDPVLDKAVEILTGKITLEEAMAESQKAAQAKKAEKKNESAPEEIAE